MSVAGWEDGEGVESKEGQEGVAISWAAWPLPLKYRAPFRGRQEYRDIQETVPDWWTPHNVTKVKDPGLTLDSFESVLASPRAGGSELPGPNTLSDTGFPER